MLEVQKFLRANNFIEIVFSFDFFTITDNFTLLEELYGISTNFHPTDPRVILNYCQIDSSKVKDHPIVKECRGLVLDRGNYEIIAKSFDRFFNLGEIEDHKNFNWDYCDCSTKEDGSLILVYSYEGKLQVNTRNSFGDGYPNGHSRTWKELVVDLLPDYFESVLSEEMWKDHTFVFELCTPYNKVVKAYPSSLFLLGIFDSWKEYTRENVDKFALYLGLTRPKSYKVRSQDDVHRLVEKLGEENPTNEGVVLEDINGMRIKVKTLQYCLLHKVKNNTGPTVENFIELALKNEGDELLCYFPEYTDKFNEIKQYIDDVYLDINKVYDQFKSILDQKEFALSIKNHQYSSILFYVRKHNLDLNTSVFLKFIDLFVKGIKAKYH